MKAHLRSHASNRTRLRLAYVPVLALHNYMLFVQLMGLLSSSATLLGLHHLDPHLDPDKHTHRLNTPRVQAECLKLLQRCRLGNV